MGGLMLSQLASSVGCVYLCNIYRNIMFIGENDRVGV